MMKNKQFFSTQLSIKALSEDGTFEGYGSVFDVVDAYGETIERGAFAESIKEKGAKGIKMLWQHDTEQPMGVYDELKEDDYGLYCCGRLALKTQRGAEAYELMQMGALDGLSIGFFPLEWTRDEEADTLTLTKIDLWEISPVTFPANNSARISAVKAFSAGEMPDLRTFERALREAMGCSKAEAKAIAAKGFKGLTAQREAEDEGTLEAARSVLARLRSKGAQATGDQS